MPRIRLTIRVAPVIRAYKMNTEPDYEQIIMETNRMYKRGDLDTFLKKFGNYNVLLNYLGKQIGC